MKTSLTAHKMLQVKNKRAHNLILFAVLALAVIAGAALFGSVAQATGAGADANAVAKQAVDAVIKVIRLIVGIVGIFFVLFGIVKIAIAHANEDSPAQQKAAMMLASGVALILLGFVILPNLNISDWLTGVSNSVQ